MAWAVNFKKENINDTNQQKTNKLLQEQAYKLADIYLSDTKF